MTSKTTNKFSPEVRTRAVRMVLDHEGEHASRWAAVVSISAKIGCTPQTLHDWVKKAETDSGKRCGAEYKRTETKFLVPHTGHASCKVCGATLESWLESTHVPAFELVKRPDRKSP